jgi:hypothetical protein
MIFETDRNRDFFSHTSSGSRSPCTWW